MSKARLKLSSKHAGFASSLREPDGVTLDLPDPVSEQISDGVNRLVAEAALGRAAASTSPLEDEEPSGASGRAAQPGPSQPVPMEGCETAEAPASASTAGPAEAPAAQVAAKKEDEGARKPLLSDDCCTCYACNISVPYKEMMGQHMMSEGHIQSVAVFYGLKPRFTTPGRGFAPPAGLRSTSPASHLGGGPPRPQGTWLPVPSLGVELGMVDVAHPPFWRCPPQVEGQGKTPCQFIACGLCLRAAREREQAEIWFPLVCPRVFLFALQVELFSLNKQWHEPLACLWHVLA